MNKFKKVSIVTALVGGIFLGTGQVYATSINSNIINLIQMVFHL